MCEKCIATCNAIGELLSNDETASVTILADNPDFNGLPNCAVDVCGEWTGYKERRFGGDTVPDALNAAIAARALGSSEPRSAHAMTRAAIERHVRQIQTLCDTFGFDTLQYLAAPLVVVEFASGARVAVRTLRSRYVPLSGMEMVVPNPAPPPRQPIEPDEDGDCKRCGIAWTDDEKSGSTKHECPPGFLV